MAMKTSVWYPEHEFGVWVKSELGFLIYSTKLFQTKAPGWPVWWLGGWVHGPIIKPLRGPSYKLRFARISVRLKFQDGPSVGISKVRLKSCFMTGVV